MTNDRDKFLDVLEKNIRNLNWERSMKDLITKFNQFKVVIGYDEDGRYFLDIITGNSRRTLTEQFCPRLRDLSNKVWDYVVNQENGHFWEDAIDGLLKYCDDDSRNKKK